MSGKCSKRDIRIRMILAWKIRKNGKDLMYLPMINYVIWKIKKYK
jgi:hypothetical protein